LIYSSTYGANSWIMKYDWATYIIGAVSQISLCDSIRRNIKIYVAHSIGD
jgi:hypothetical protein